MKRKILCERFCVQDFVWKILCSRFCVQDFVFKILCGMKEETKSDYMKNANFALLFCQKAKPSFRVHCKSFMFSASIFTIQHPYNINFLVKTRLLDKDLFHSINILIIHFNHQTLSKLSTLSFESWNTFIQK